MKDEPKAKHRERADLLMHIYRNCDNTLRLYAWGICRQFHLDPSFAEDLLQDCYLQVLERYEIIAPRYAELGSRYLCRMLYHKLLDRRRKHQRTQLQENTYAGNMPAISDIYDMHTEQFYEEFYSSMKLWLTEEDYRIMKRYAEGYSYKELSEEFDIPVSTVGVRIHRAKRRMAVVLLVNF